MPDCGSDAVVSSWSPLVSQQSSCRSRAASPLSTPVQISRATSLAYVTKDQAETSVLFELISARYERRSILITANQPFGEWNRVFPDSTIRLAAVDRLVHHATIFEMNVESFRLIFDELGFVLLSKIGAELLFELISQRYVRGATLITSNLPFDE